MKSTQGYLMHDFGSHAEYMDTVTYAEQLGVLVWRDDKERKFFVTSVDQLRVFLANKGKNKG